MYAYLLLCQHLDWEEITLRLIYCDLEGINQRCFDQIYTKEMLEPFVQKCYVFTWSGT